MRTIYIFLLLLIISNSFSQDKFENKTKLTFYKLINEYDDGPSHINGYLKDNTTYFTQKVTIENCDKIILDLLKIKRKSKKWKYSKFDYSKSCIGCDVVESMLVLEYNNYSDTIYYSPKNNSIISLNENMEQYDERNQILKIINSNSTLQSFNDLKFNEYLEFLRNFKSDSISIDDIKIDRKNLYKLDEKELSEAVGGFHSSTIFSEIYNDWKIEKSFERNNSKYTFYDSDKIKKIELALNKSKLEDESDFFEFEIEINDRLIQPNEKYIVEIFPRYREYLNLKREYFYDQDGTYSMKIDFIDNKGNLEFIFENEKLISIVINYIY